MRARQVALIVAAVVAAGCGGMPAASTPPTETRPAPTPPAAPVSSDGASDENGGGCYPESVRMDLVSQFVAINPEWAPVENGQMVDSDPITLHGTVAGSSEAWVDFPATHVTKDWGVEIALDEAERGWLATGNLDMENKSELELEWETGSWPAWARPGVGDRIVAMGRWIFDCGHSGATAGHCSTTTTQACVIDSDCGKAVCTGCVAGETCRNAHFNYASELHPPHATAVLRTGRGAQLDTSANAPGVPATIADIWVNPDGGAAGDRCILTHQDPPTDVLLNTDCFPLSQPVAQINLRDFVFDVPLPPRPPNGMVKWRFIPRMAPGDVPADVDVEAHDGDATPHLTVRVKLSQSVNGKLPNGYAGTLVAGYTPSDARLTHVRVTVEALSIKNALKPRTPIVNEAKAWHAWVAVDGNWVQLTGLDAVGSGVMVPQSAVFDEWLPPDGRLRVSAQAQGESCLDTLFGIALSKSLRQLQAGGLGDCLQAFTRQAGTIEDDYAGPDFGAGQIGSAEHESAGQGSDGGLCATSKAPCILDADCESDEKCIADPNGAYTLRYKIEELP